MAGREPAARARSAGIWLLLALLVFAYYLGLATQFGYQLWPSTSGGFVFNSQLRSLLELRMDIDPRIIGNEAFVREGRTYTYFGIWPALLRLPLLTQLWRDWTALSCAAAATLAALALLKASGGGAAAARSATTRLSALTLAATWLLSGPQVELLGRPSVYVEAVLWAYACACLFVCFALPLLSGGEATTRRLGALAACAAVALLTRISAGLSLYAAFLALAGVLVWRWRGAGLTPRACLRRLLAPGALLLLALLVTGGVNTLRWGEPLEFAPLTLNRYYAANPARLERLARHGTFGLARIPDALSYYAVPVWFFDAPADSARAARVATLFDSPEGPPVGLFQAQGLWLALGLLGGAALAAGALRPVSRPAALAVAAGLAVGPLIVMSYHYLAFRYRAEFTPLILLFALLGARALQTRAASLPGALRGLLMALLLAGGAAQIVAAHAALRAYACTPMGSYVAARQAALDCLSAGTSAAAPSSR